MMKWESYILRKKRGRGRKSTFRPRTQQEAKDALALGIIDIGDYVEFSLSLEPVLDSVHDPDPDTRKQAIQTLAQRRDPLSIQLLHYLLLDQEEEVRLAAATTLEVMEKEMHTRIHQFRQELKADPNDREKQFRLAQTYIDYASVLLMNRSLQRFFLGKALAYLDELIEAKPGETRFLLARGQTYQLLDEPGKAKEDFRRCISLDAKCLPAFMGLAECLFKLKQFTKIKDIMQSLPETEQEQEVTDARIFWTEG